jgi:hypothetical protein
MVDAHERTPRSASMASQKKQVKRLKKDAQRLWDDQQALLTRANAVGRDAIPHVQRFAKDAVDKGIPGARTAVAEKVAPAVGKAGKAAGGYAASTAKDAFSGVLLPAVTSAGAAAVALAEEAGSRLGLSDSVVEQGDKLTKKLDVVTKAGHKSGAKGGAKLRAAAKAGGAAAKKASGQKSGIGAGRVVLILLGVGLIAGIGYAVWQTLRADDDLWVADEDTSTN